jgi:beta-galactosidase
MRTVCFGWVLLKAILAVATGADANPFLPAVPEGDFLQAYDDCGVAARQPHVLMKDCYLWTFNTSDTDAGLKERSAVFGPKSVQAVYTNLNPNLSYVLALTYANDHVYHRVQSLEAGDGIVLHDPYTLPKGKATRVIVKVPSEATRDGKLTLTWKLHGEANVTVSIIELWADAPMTRSLTFNSLVGLQDGLQGQVVDLTFDNVSNAQVSLSAPGNNDVLVAQTDLGGVFSFSRKAIEGLAAGGAAILSARQGRQEGRTSIKTANLFFEPVHYRPLPERTAGLAKNSLLLNGAWRLKTAPGDDMRERSLSEPGWATFNVPGQWRQQGFDVPQDQPVAVAKEFMIPKEWAGYRIFLRFDAIHGGTHYWLNGRPLGYSENLFTPVEWEITDAARPGQTNRLDLQMIVATTSERLSYSSGYVSYSLGGIDRAVRIYALPQLQISSLHLNAGLDTAYRDGELQIDLSVDNPDKADHPNVEALLRLYNAKGRETQLSVSKVALGQIKPGFNAISLKSRTANPLKWNAEQPNLYRLVIELAKDGKVLERIERNIGFRKIEIKGRQLYVNGARVKLAGVCHHEIDPLTGRADTMRHAEEDVQLFKSANLNDVRTSHYPPTQEFLDAADRFGLYVESEAPLCWEVPADDLSDLKEALTPISAMIDYNHSHPCVIIWSLENEPARWGRAHDYCNKLAKELDPTRPTTINGPGEGEEKVTCDIMNRHYQEMPYDRLLNNDPRPFMHGECFFVVYHERTDVTVDPGLRELWAQGSADPASDWGKACLDNFTKHGQWHPGIYPGAWSYIYKSERVIGSEIWSGIDDITVLPGGKVVSCENGNAFWGLFDGWRRPKPELECAKFLFSPVWFPVRCLDYKSGQTFARVPIENRYSFTDLSNFDFAWEIGGAKGNIRQSISPASTGEIEIPIPKGVREGSPLLLRVLKGGEETVNATLSLGQPKPAALPQPQAGAPKWTDNGKTIIIKGRRFSLVLDRAAGDFDSTNPDHRAPFVHFPSLHVTRHDFGDLDNAAPPYAEFPDAKTRVVENVTAAENGAALEMTVKDRYEHFAGAVHWLIDNDGVGAVSYDYTYTGSSFDSREIGLKALLRAEYDEVQWRRWSEWGIFPKDSICRTEGAAKAHRDKKWPDVPPNIKPIWAWSQDQTELGTADFRSVKFNIYEASLVAPNHSGVRVDANADAHFRSCLAGDGVMMHILAQCPVARVPLNNGDRLTGKFAVRLIGNP